MTISSFHTTQKLSYSSLILPFDATLKIYICSGRSQFLRRPTHRLSWL